MKLRKVILTALVSAYVVMWIGGVIALTMRGGPPPEAEWAAPVFLLLAGLITLVPASRANLGGLLAAAGIGLIAEHIGVNYGFLFGRYVYTGTLRPLLLGAPLVMASAWMVLFAYVKQTLLLFKLSKPVEMLIAGVWMVLIDLLIDPLAANRLGYWRWIDTGAYYGVPARNFLGWFAVSAVIFGIVGQRPQSDSWARSVGLSILLFFTVIAVTYQLALAASAGLVLSLAHLALAVRNVGRRKILRLYRRLPPFLV
ncbi:MAG: carotenoid biosynthesis protein [Chloracidobacterium sp.]|nr:carotenoid biosynthesis protein [Chloracidobacterium sp.]